MNNDTVYTISEAGEGFVILADGQPLENNRGYTRTFRSRSSARKALSRIRRGVTR